MEELNDVYQHFLLYYGNEVPKMKAYYKNKVKLEKEKLGEGDDGEKFLTRRN